MRRSYLSCPAVSQSWSRTVLSSRYMVLERKSIPMVAWYVLSKESYMKRVMSDVFPTLCSPKNTNLNFLRGLENSVFVIFTVFLDEDLLSRPRNFVLISASYLEGQACL